MILKIYFFHLAFSFNIRIFYVDTYQKNSSYNYDTN